LSAGSRAIEYRRLAERLRSLSERAGLPEAKAELLWLAQSYERLARVSADGVLMDGYAPLERHTSESLDRVAAD
jgi:hypothetical protein